jgi:hypothetical protein
VQSRALAVAVVLSACGDAAAGGPALLTAAPTAYLLTIDELVSPDFAAVEPAHTVTGTELASGDAAVRHELVANGLSSAAREGFFRQADLRTVNGPVEVIVTVEAFRSVAGAQRTIAGDVRRRDASAGEAAISTGPLGDTAHADSDVTIATDGVRVVQFVVEWRVRNLVNLIVVRGRDGGTRLDDALLLARRMTAGE